MRNQINLSNIFIVVHVYLDEYSIKCLSIDMNMINIHLNRNFITTGLYNSPIIAKWCHFYNMWTRLWLVWLHHFPLVVTFLSRCISNDEEIFALRPDSVCSSAGVQMYVCNRDRHGYLPVPLEQDQTLEEEQESFAHTLTEALSTHLLPFYVHDVVDPIRILNIRKNFKSLLAVSLLCVSIFGLFALTVLTHVSLLR